ncbi:hypothetical protein ACOBQX_07335 [Actinokineospora sp. G85]|uniref:hypothetical protein n=1 Tax=Actinokineospora sp. G85 TaxID=3406626 RepID=UPI003C70B4DC
MAGEVVLDPVGTNRVQDAAQPTGPVGGLHGLDHGVAGVVLAEPDLSAHPRVAGHGSGEHAAVLQGDRAGRLALVHLGKVPQANLHGGGDRGHPEVQVVSQQPDRVIGRERLHLRPRYQVRPHRPRPGAGKPGLEIGRQEVVDA